MVKAVINKHSGLQGDDVKSIVQDAHHNIWCALENGISKIDYASPVSYYHSNAGLEGSVHAITNYNGKLMAGTTTGLFAENIQRALDKSLEFVPVSGISDQVWDLVMVGDKLAIGTGNGVFLMTGNHIRKIGSMNAFKLCHLEKENLLLVGGSGGLSALSTGSWSMVKEFEDVREDIKSIAVNRSSLYDATEVWIGTSLQGTAKILIYPDLSHQTCKYYGSGDGLPDDWVLPMEYRDSVVLGTRMGPMQFVDEMVVRENLPDSLKEFPEYYRGYFEGRSIFGHAILLPLNFITDYDGLTWAIIDNEIKMIRSRLPGEIIDKPFRGIDMGKINRIYPEDDRTLWFAAGEGLARFDLRSIQKPTGGFYAALRTVMLTGDSVIFNGTYPLADDFTPAVSGSGYSGTPTGTSAASGKPVGNFKQPGTMIPVIHPSYNDLTFFFTSNFYDNEDKNLFSWMLKDRDAAWSSWTDRRITSYTNLREGEYEFLLRSQNIYGEISEQTGFRFIVRPPWFRTFPAYAGYFILLILLVYTAVRIGQVRLRRKNERLEAIVEERTEEIRKQNVELASQKKEITDSIQYAERIQRAILPHTEKIAGKVEGYFILFKPKDIVSGDFYWVAENRDKIIVTAVDCTGHGVPGAFMSMLGVSFLNKIILENNTLEAHRILNDLRENVVSSLKQTGQEGEARDGMDMSLIVIDLENMTMEFAGANNPLYMIRQEELTETKADRMPIAYHMQAGSFSNHRIELRKGDTFYLFSDGYADQFGGPRGKKFMYKPFKRLLIENRDKTMEEINQILDDTLEEWKAPEGAEGEIFEQVDDILVIGVRI
jgi:serine phosphatase RsbU (regulator of sigma subunit)